MCATSRTGNPFRYLLILWIDRKQSWNVYVHAHPDKQFGFLFSSHGRNDLFDTVLAELRKGGSLCDCLSRQTAHHQRHQPQRTECPLHRAPHFIPPYFILGQKHLTSTHWYLTALSVVPH